MEKSDDAIAPGWIDFWRLWRHCLCRFGWYPLFVAPLVTCACLLDIYSTTGCDFIRLDIGFIPTNDIWSTSASYAQLGLFSYDTNRDDENKWKRSFNNGCQAYSSDFESVFINEDQTWSISRILAYISGISSLVALSTAWLLTVTPIPASFFWPGVLLPAVILAMLTGAAKFVFFDTHICTEELWYVDEASDPVAAQSCDLGESSVFGVASVAAYFFCTILICFRSPQKRELDENYGRPQTAILNQAGGDSTGTPNTLAEIGYSKSDPEQGEETAVVASVQQQQQQEQSVVAAPLRKRVSLNDMSERTAKMNNSNNNDINTAPQVIVEHGRHHTRNTSDVTWITDPTYTSFNDRTKNLGLGLSPRSPVPTRISEATESSEEEGDLEWNKDGHPIIIAINDSDGSIDQTLSTKSLNGLPPRPNRTKSDISSNNGCNHRPLQSSISNSSSGRTHSTSESDDAGSVHSRISRISFSETYASDDISGLGHYSIGSQQTKSTGAPSVVQIPTSRSSSTRHHHHTFSGGSPGSISHSPGNRKASRYNKKRSEHDKFLNTNQQEHDIFLNNNNHHDHSHTRTDSKRELITLPRLDESLEDHGDLINQCVRDLHQSFATGDNANGYKTL